MPTPLLKVSMPRTALSRALSALVALASIGSTAQVIPSSRSTSWGLAGPGVSVPGPSVVLDLADLGGVADGVTPNDAAMLAALEMAQGGSALIQLPPGILLFNATLDMPDGIVLRGAGADSTTLRFAISPTAHCIRIAGEELPQAFPLSADALRGSSHLPMASTAGLSVGDAVRLYRNDSALVVSWWAMGAAGQIAHVTAVQADGIDIAAPLRADFTMVGSAYLRLLRPARRCGVECLRIERTTAPDGQFSNIWMYAADGCWVRGVESVNCGFAHVELYTSTNCEFSGSWLHHAFSYGGGGEGYGVLAYLTAGENLIVDNVFEHLRHAMIVQAGANGNVFAYNYSLDPNWDEGFFPANSAGDIVLHGDYPFMNLFEGNIVQNIVVDDSHGSNGPFNTVFRNRADLWGFVMNNGPATDSLNIVGNDVTADAPMGLWLVNGTGHLLHGNLVQGEVTPEGTGTLDEASCFLAAEPAFLASIGGWPQTGPDHLPPGTLPAVERRTSGAGIAPCGSPAIGVDEHVMIAPRVYPVPAHDHVVVEGLPGAQGPFSARITDLTGATCFQWSIPATNRAFISLSDLSPSAYLLELIDVRGRTLRTRIIVQ